MNNAFCILWMNDTYYVLFSKIQYFAEETVHRDKNALRKEIHQRAEEVFPAKRRKAYLKMRRESNAKK